MEFDAELRCRETSVAKRKLLRNLAQLELQPDVKSIHNALTEEIENATHNLPGGKTPKFWWEDNLVPVFKEMQAAYQSGENMEQVLAMKEVWKKVRYQE